VVYENGNAMMMRSFSVANRGGFSLPATNEDLYVQIKEDGRGIEIGEGREDVTEGAKRNQGRKGNGGGGRKTQTPP
jgi:hypothetical protein